MKYVLISDQLLLVVKVSLLLTFTRNQGLFHTCRSNQMFPIFTGSKLDKALVIGAWLISVLTTIFYLPFTKGSGKGCMNNFPKDMVKVSIANMKKEKSLGYHRCIDSVYGYVRFKHEKWSSSMYYYKPVHQTLTQPYTLSPIRPNVSSFAHREQVAPNLTPNQYHEKYRLQ